VFVEYSWTKSIGLGFKTPLDAKEGTYIDKKCPWTGNVAIRGKLLRGVVVSNKMKRTIIIRRDYLLVSFSYTLKHSTRALVLLCGILLHTKKV